MFVRSAVALSLLSGALAGPLRRNATNETVGSIYVMTNGQDHNGNGIVSVNIAADGSLSYAGVTPANGLGAHGAVLPVDPILTAGSIRVHEDLGLAAVVNAGSNTIQLFGLNSENPGMLTPFGEPFYSQGDFPGAVEFNNEGTLLCAVNNGINANVVCFKLIDGGRQIVPGAPRPIHTKQALNPPTGPGDSIGTVRFTLDQQRIVTTVKGHFGDVTNTPGYIAVWGIDEQSEDIISEDFDQNFIPPPFGIEFSLTEVPGHLAYVTADLIGVDVFDLTGGTTNIPINSLRIPGGVANCWSAYSSKTNTFFISDIITSNLTEISVDADLKPSIVTQYHIPNTRVNEGKVVDVAGTQYLYILFTGTTSVGAFRLDGPGNAVLVQTLDFSAPVEASGFAVDPLSLAGLATFMPGFTQ